MQPISTKRCQLCKYCDSYRCYRPRDRCKNFSCFEKQDWRQLVQYYVGTPKDWRPDLLLGDYEFAKSQGGKTVDDIIRLVVAWQLCVDNGLFDATKDYKYLKPRIDFVKKLVGQ